MLLPLELERPVSRQVLRGGPKGSIGNPTSALGEARREGAGRQVGVGGRSRIALQCALNKCVHLGLISSDALFSDPICLSPGKFGDRLPSHCESIILQIYSRQTSHYNRCQQRNLSCRGTTNHEKEAEATRYANKTTAPATNVNRHVVTIFSHIS